jgi:DNA-binding transcriptional ArsR family regulator
MTAAKLTSEEAVIKALASQGELTSAEIATATGLGRSTVTKALAALEREGMTGRNPGGREGRRRLPDRWSVASDDRPAAAGSSAQRLRPGQLDGLVLDFVNGQGKDAVVGATAVAKALGRSAGAVGNCLARLTAAGQMRQVSERPRRYSSATTPSTKRGRTRRSRKEQS